MRRCLLACLASLPFLLAAGESALADGPPRPHNVLVSHLRTEPVVAIDPTDPSIIVAGANTDYIRQPDGTFPVPFFTSHDGGGSFNVGTLPMPSPYVTGADTSVAIARDGTVFYSYLAESPTYCSGGPGAILLAHSIDLGVSFKGPVIVDSNPVDDRPTMTIESVPNQPSHVFVSWTRDFLVRTEIWFARSVDGGATFSPATMLYSSNSVNFGAQPVFGPDGRLYVFWLNSANAAPADPAPGRVLLAISSDDGAHFDSARTAGRRFSTLPQLGQPGGLRDLSTFAAAASSSGSLYLSYAAVRVRHRDGSAGADILVTRSRDFGMSWSKPKRVNDFLNGDRFMPAMSVLGDGSLGIAYYDRRAGSGELDLYAARVSFGRGFRASPNVRVNNAPSPTRNVRYIPDGNSCLPSGRFFGDYIGTAPSGTALDVVWTDSQPQQKDETDMWFARVVLPAAGYHVATSSPSSSGFIAWLASIGDHLPTRGMSGTQLVMLCMFLLLPGLSVATCLMSLRRSGS
jgi:hypothetical protein